MLSEHLNVGSLQGFKLSSPEMAAECGCKLFLVFGQEGFIDD
jgi:hypothetical protein